MTTSLTEFLTSEAPKFDYVDVADLSYFRGRLKNRIHDLMLDTFSERERDGLTRSDLARLMHKRPEQVTRLLGSSGNVTMDTISDFFLALGLELDFNPSDLRKRPTHNFQHEIAAFAPMQQRDIEGGLLFQPRGPTTKTSPSENRVTLQIEAPVGSQ